MRQWLCNIICRSKGAAPAVAERANHDSYDFETKIRDLRKRIEEQRSRLGHTPTQSPRIHQPKEVAQQEPIVDAARAAKNAELNDLKAKLLAKKK
jgi:hypothetical protein